MRNVICFVNLTLDGYLSGPNGELDWMLGRPDAAMNQAFTDAMRDLGPGDDLLVLTWLDRADRSVTRVHPRGDQTRTEQGVFSTRSPHRPNPVGLHRVRVLEVDGLRVRVSDMEAIDGTPIVDVKPVLGDDR